MLNKLQNKQLHALRQRLEYPHSVADGIDTHPDLSIVLFNNYVAEVGEQKFINKALEKVTDIKDLGKNNYTYMTDKIKFFKDNRLEIIAWFEEFIERMDRESPIIEMADAVEYGLIEARCSEVTAHDAGFVVYGNDESHEKYGLIAEKLSEWVAEKAAELLFDVASNLENEPLIQTNYRISEFINFDGNIDWFAMGLDISSYLLEEHNEKNSIDSAVFAANALEYIDVSHDRRVDGKIPELTYLTDEQAIRFYNSERVSILDWLNKYVHLETTPLEHGDLLSSLHQWLNNIGLMPNNNGISISDFADILYADKKDHKYFELAVKGLSILVVEQLTTNYQIFYESDFF